MRRKQTVNRSGENGTTTARKKEQMKEVGKKTKETDRCQSSRGSQLIYMPQHISILTALNSVCVPSYISACE